MADPIATAASADSKLIEGLKDYIPHVLKYYGTPGLNLAIARHGEVIWDAAFGYADLERKIQMTTDTVFHSGSMGKTYTATAVMQLIERGTMRLDDPINEYLTRFRIDNPLGDRVITFRDLLTHRSGLTMDLAGSQFEPPTSLGGYIRDICTGTHFPSYGGSLRPLWGTRVGEKYVYSNLGIAMLGYLVEVINPEHLSFSSYVQKYIIDPLGMTSTQFPEAQDAAHIQADIYRRMSKGYMHFGAVHLPTPTIYFAEYPAGGVVSIPRDHIRVLLAYMNGGRYHDYQLLKPETVKLMLSPEAEMGDGNTVGLVWHLSQFGKPNYAFGHGGAHMWGWANRYLAFPTQDLAIVVATNHWHMADDEYRYAESDAIADFASSWIANETRRPHAAATDKSWEWRVSYVMGLVFVEHTNGALGITTRISPKLVEDIARGASVQAGVTYDENLWDADGFRAGVQDMQAVEMNPSAIRAFMSSPDLQVSREELKLLYRELGASAELIPWPTFGPEVAEHEESVKRH
jgi:CubicO group peptidase (beta-lactamase class C family)